MDVFGTARGRGRQVGAVALVVIVVLSGCSGPFASEGTTSVGDRSPPVRAESGPVPTGIENVTLSESQRSELADLATNFYAKLPAEESERRAATLRAAAELCRRHEQLGGAVNVTEMARQAGAPELVHDRSRRAAIAIDVIDRYFNERLDRQRTVDWLRTVEHHAVAAVPLYLSYNRMAEDACVAADERSDAAIEEFYFSTFYFGLEAFLIASGARYEPSYRTTRFLATKGAMVYRVGVVCEDCDLLALSEIHSQVRDRPQSLVRYVQRRVGDTRVSFEGTPAQWRYILERQGVTYARAVLRECPGELADAVGGENASDVVAWVKERGKEAANGTLGVGNVGESTIVDAAVSCATG